VERALEYRINKVMILIFFWTKINLIIMKYILMILIFVFFNLTLLSQTTDPVYAPQIKSDVVLDLKVFLEGPYFNSQMTPFVNVLGFLPVMQPYNQEPWSYPGSEAVISIPSFNIIDWILIEIVKPSESKSDSFETITRCAGFILNNGKVTDVDGVSDITLQLDETSGFYVKISHRNHLPVISSDSVVGNNGVYSWNFATGSEQAMGDILSQNEIAAGVWGMISGNGDGNNQINNYDKNEIWLNDLNSFGYYLGDFDMDCQVNVEDLIVNWKENVGCGVDQ